MKFKDLLHLNQDELLPNAARIRKSITKRRNNFKRLVWSGVLGAFLLLISSICLWFGYTSTPISDDEIVVVKGSVNVINSIVASEETKLGIALDSTLLVETSEVIPLDEMCTRLAINPQIPFEVEEISDCQYEIIFEDGLEADTLYKVSAMYNGSVVHRWAFQTENVFSVLSSYPSDNDVVSNDSAIEFVFSHRQVSGFEEAFSITPAVSGSFKHYGRTWAFIPDSPLKNSTYYTITLNSSIKGPGEVSLGENYQVTFRINDGDRYLNQIYKDNEITDTFLVDESPVIALSYNGINVDSAKVRVYSLKDSNAYISAYKNYVKCGFIKNEIVSLAKNMVMEFEAQPLLGSDYKYYGNAAFINYPEPLSSGYYLSEIEIDGLKVYQLLQSTTLSVYTLSTNGEYMVWAHDTVNGKPLKNAEVKLDGFEAVYTNEHGIVEFKNAEEKLAQRFLIIENKKPYVVVLNGESTDKEISLRSTYFSYITTNSAIYRSGDKVGIFGAIIPRVSGSELPDSVTVNCEFFEEAIEVDLRSDGTFQTELVIPSTAMKTGLISLEVDDCWINSTSFTIADYHLPKYSISVSTDKSVYMAGEIVYVTAQVTYMDGTPAAGVKLSEQDEIVGISDENGCVYLEREATVDYDYVLSTGYPEQHYLELSIAEGEEANVSGNVSYLAFASSYIIDASYKAGNLTIFTNMLKDNLAATLTSDLVADYGYNLELLKGKSITASVQVDLHEITYTKEISGSTYDPINKVVDYTWKYTEQDVVFRSFEVNCKNGIGTIEIPERSDREKQYYVTVRLNGSEGQAGTKVFLVQNDYENQYLSESYRLITNQTVYDIGEIAVFSICKSGVPLTGSKGEALYAIYNNGIMELYQSEQTTFELEFKKEYAPDICVYGAYFDGKHIYSLGYEYLEYDIERSQLNIEIAAEKEKYQPGEEVTLNFNVKDVNNNPVKAVLNISVVDRALYLLEPNADNPLYSLMNSQCFMSPVYITTSHYDFGVAENGLGKGGGGGELDVRSDFEDTPCFETIETDKRGKGKLSFVLPDTLTEWKIISKAVTSDAKAGCSVFDLVSTQDFFVTASLGDRIKTADDFTVAVKCDGSDFKRNDTCRVDVSLQDFKGNVVKKMNSNVKKAEYAYLNFGKLKAGNYSVVVSGKNKKSADKILLSFEVAESNSSVWIYDQNTLDDKMDLHLNPVLDGVTLTIADEDLAFWQEAMSRLKSSYGDRPDQILGQYLAEQFYESGAWMGDEIDYTLLQEYSCYDGVSFVPGAQESDLYLSAKMAAVAPEFFDRNSLSNGFYYYAENRNSARVDVLTAYFGLAAIGEPVLLDIQAIYETEGDLSVEESTYLALAFAYAGDFDTARYIFETELEGLIVEDEELYYVAIDGTLDEAITGNCTLLSNRLNLKYAEGLIRYVASHDSEYTLLNLELIAYLNDHVVEISGENKVVIKIGDESQEYSYLKQKPLIIKLTADEAKSVSIQRVEGNSVVAYSYDGTIAELSELGRGKIIGMKNKFNAIGNDESKVLQFEVEVPKDFKSPTLNFGLPVGLRLEEVRITTNNMTYTFNDQYGSGAISALLPNEECLVEVVVRGALPGEYLFEPFVIVNSANNQYLTTTETTVLVR